MIMRKEMWSFLLLLCVFLIPTLCAYFGVVVPSHVGLLSDLLVFSLGLTGALLSGMLGKRFFLAYLVTFWLSCVLLVVTNWWHYQFFRAYFNFESLKLGGDVLEAFRSLPAFEYKWESLALFLTTGIALVGAVLLYRRDFYRGTGVVLMKVVCIGLALYSFGAVSDVTDVLKKRNAFVLLPEYFHPLHAFFLSYESGSVDDKGWKTFKALNQQVVSGVADSEITGAGAKKYNVITIVMESMRASMVGLYNPASRLTPNIDEVGKHGIVIEDFYANSNLTIKAETSIFCGLYDHGAKVSIAEYPDKKQVQCLPRLLKNSGYDTYYFHGNTARFYNRDEYLPQIGFGESYFHKDQEGAGKDGRSYSGWGLSDGDMYEIMLDHLENRMSDKPFFANIMTLTSHYPFNADLPVDVLDSDQSSRGKKDRSYRVYRGYKRSVAYADYAFGAFWKKFRHSPLFEKTIVVITGDHGIWSFPESVQDQSVRNEYFFRMPLVIYHPDLTEPVVINGPASQIDIMPTLASLLGISMDSTPHVGRNILSRVEAPWAVYGKSGELFLRYGDNVCYNPTVECGGAQQSCFSSLSVKDVAKDIACDTHDGDLLQGGKTVPKKVNEKLFNLYQASYEMVAFDNQRVFSEPGKLISVQPKHEFNLELR